METFLRRTNNWYTAYDMKTGVLYRVGSDICGVFGMLVDKCKCEYGPCDGARIYEFGDVNFCIRNARVISLKLSDFKCVWCRPSETSILYSCYECFVNALHLHENLEDYIESPEICSIVRLYI